MKILITGICGFVGSTLARALREVQPDWQLVGIDNLSRTGSWLNRTPLAEMGIEVIHGDLRMSSDLDQLPAVDWVIDAAANPSVLAGVDGTTSGRQLVEHNLLGTVNLLEYCKRASAGFILLSTSRVYSIPGIAALQLQVCDDALAPSPGQSFPEGITANGISEAYSTAPPTSLYGSTKVCSEHLALEYGQTYGFPVWINRCGVLAGKGQFAQPAQGIFSYWVHSYREQSPLKYIGFGGEGHQVRDCLHPHDLLDLLLKQIAEGSTTGKPRTVNLGGGVGSARSLAQLSAWCSDRFDTPREHFHPEASPHTRPFDLGWVVLDCALAQRTWGWQPQTTTNAILSELADFAESQPHWLQTTTS